MDFPDDPKVANISDQWTMGSGLMVAPVLQQGAVIARPSTCRATGGFPSKAPQPVEGDQTITATAVVGSNSDLRPGGNQSCHLDP